MYQEIIVIALLILTAIGLLLCLNTISGLKRKQEELLQQLQVVNSSLAKQDQLTRAEFAHNRGDLDSSLRNFGNLVLGRMDNFALQLNNLTALNEQKLEKLRDTVEQKLSALQEDNNKKLEKMRETVDEKLHATLEQRLGDSFKLVSERLEQVHKSLGEMQTLANGVGDLKKVLTNVKNRGTLGEIQLENLLEQLLTREQYEKNVATRKNSTERVEFALKLPGRSSEDNSCLWLPIDAKFPLEDYQRLLEAWETANAALAEEAGKHLESRIKACAKDIQEKYLEPPQTTDFGIMFLPIEGLYAEVLRRPGLFEALQRDYRVIIAGPTVLAALLNSLQMGFHTLALQKRSSEVWSILGSVKNEFEKFGGLLDKAQKHINSAGETIEHLKGTRTNAINRKLRDIQLLPAEEVEGLVAGPEDNE